MAQTTLEILQQKLNDAEQKYHEIQLTGQVRRVRDQNGEEVEYGPVNIQDLRKYIAELRSQIAALQGITSVSTPVPMRPFF